MPFHLAPGPSPRAPSGAVAVPALALATVVQVLAAGEPEALAELVTLTLGVVWGLAWRITGQADRADAVTERVYRQAWRDAAQLAAAPQAVLALLTLRCRAEALRERAAGGPAEPPWPPPDPIAGPPQAPLWAPAMAGLTALQRSLVSDRLLHNLPLDTLAARHGLGLAQARQQLLQAQALLRAALDPSAAPADPVPGGPPAAAWPGLNP